ncbi:MAG: DUF5683 domain-containing protein [Longimicrobiales bacterium]|nr:DUF5683 domain-containing protein [Longimicrobiales bacterium]
MRHAVALRVLWGLVLAVALGLGAVGDAGAQDGTAPGTAAGAPPQEQQADEAPAFPGVSPGGAFLRSLAIPGWGHAATGSYTRAGFYFATSGATFWMLNKSLQSLDSADDHLALVESELEKELQRAGITNPDSVSARLGADERVTSMRALVESREQQVEDWTAFGIFWLLLNATDAFVSAHLADFPEPVEIDLLPGTPGQPSELRFSVPVGGPDR